MILEIKNYLKVKSTNDIAIKFVKKKLFKPKIIFSNNQTSGRGTMGKKWVSYKGNFFASILFDVTSIKVKPEQISILNPYIIKRVLKKYTHLKITIKWPNDILIKKKKICGILQEVVSFKLKKFIIIGIGINTMYAPKNKNFKSINLSSISTKNINNKEILKDIKISYEKFIEDINKYKISYLKKKLHT